MWELARLEAEKEAGKDMCVDVDVELGGGCLVEEVLEEEGDEASGSEGGKADGGCESAGGLEKESNPRSCRVSASGECYESWVRQQKPARGSSKGDTRSATPLNWDL